MSDKFISRAKAWEDATNNGNVDALDEVYDQNVVRHLPSAPDVVGLDTLKRGVLNNRLTSPDVKYTCEEMLVDGDNTAFRFKIEGTNTGKIPDSPLTPTGKKWVLKGCNVAHTINGKVVEEWMYMDTLGMFQQLGYIPSNEEIFAQNS